jgi:hypothetical protein
MLPWTRHRNHTTTSIIGAVAVFLLFLSCCNNKKPPLRLAFTGDVNLSRGVEDELRLHGESRLTEAFSILGNHDFLIINLEGCLTDSGLPQEGEHYVLKASPKRVHSLHKAGVTHVSVANNHSDDYGETGFSSTLRALQSHGLEPLGEQAGVCILEQHDQRCALLAASLIPGNDKLAIQSVAALKEAVSQASSKHKGIPLIIYIHWGLEYQYEPEPWQRELAAELISLGADAIVGHHPHVSQTVEFFDGKPVLYSLGNFVADVYLPGTEYGLTLSLEVQGEELIPRLIPVQLSDYFAKTHAHYNKEEAIQQQLGFSEEICVIQTSRGCLVKPLEMVDFQEDTDEWLVFNKGAFAKIKKLGPRSHLVFFEKDEIRANPVNLHGELSELSIADINQDGDLDLLVGIGKKVHFDPVEAKRIQIYSFSEGALKPLWLGTRFMFPVEQFQVVYQDRIPYLATVEMRENGEKFNGRYQWDEFGFRLVEDIGQD